MLMVGNTGAEAPQDGLFRTPKWHYFKAAQGKQWSSGIRTVITEHKHIVKHMNQ